MAAAERSRGGRDRPRTSRFAMPTDSQAERARRKRTAASTFPAWFLSSIRRYQVFLGVQVRRPPGPFGCPWSLYFSEVPGVPNAIMQADHLWTGKGASSDWGRWIDELRHRRLIVVTEATLDSFSLFKHLDANDWPVHYLTADGRVVTVERTLSVPWRPSGEREPYLRFTADGRLGPVAWMSDVPSPHFLLEPAGFEWLDRAMATNGGGARQARGAAGGRKSKPVQPAWERLQIIRSDTGDDLARLDGEEYRLTGANDAVFLEELQKRKGKPILAQSLERACGERPSRIYGRLPRPIQRTIDKPGLRTGKKGYRML